MEEKSEHIIRAEHFKAGWESGEEAERERIIALLEAQLPKTVNDAFDELIGIPEVIALIKGETE